MRKGQIAIGGKLFLSNVGEAQTTLTLVQRRQLFGSKNEADSVQARLTSGLSLLFRSILKIGLA